MSETTSAAAPAAAPASDPAAAPAPGTTLLTPAAAPAAAVVDPAAPAAVTAPIEAAPVIPEKYEFKAPEGVTLDPVAVEAFSPIAKDLKLTNEQAQKLVDLQVAQSARALADQHVAWKAVTDKWAAEARSDKDIGGAKFEENLGVASKAIDKFGTPELRKALSESGMGNHPAVVKFFVNVGRQLSEDTIASGNAGSGAPRKTAAEILFPSLNQ